MAGLSRLRRERACSSGLADNGRLGLTGTPYPTGAALPLKHNVARAVSDAGVSLIGGLFALITARFEDGAGRALEAQRPAGKDVAMLTRQLRGQADDILALLDAVTVIGREAG